MLARAEQVEQPCPGDRRSRAARPALPSVRRAPPWPGHRASPARCGASRTKAEVPSPGPVRITAQLKRPTSPARPGRGIGQRGRGLDPGGTVSGASDFPCARHQAACTSTAPPRNWPHTSARLGRLLPLVPRCAAPAPGRRATACTSLPPSGTSIALPTKPRQPPAFFFSPASARRAQRSTPAPPARRWRRPGRPSARRPRGPAG